MFSQKKSKKTTLFLIKYGYAKKSPKKHRKSMFFEGIPLKNLLFILLKTALQKVIMKR